MAERISNRAFAEVLAQDYVRELREAYPDIVEEWERQRADAIAGGDSEECWPDTQTAKGIAWWLESEIPMTTYYMNHSTDRMFVEEETWIGQFCMSAAHLIRRFLADGDIRM